MPIREKILAMGVTGSGKSYQWLKLARALKASGAKFRCIDTNDAIPFMMETQFPDLKPENGGNVYVHPAMDWLEYKEGLKWVKESEPVAKDWLVLDMADDPWERVQRYFVSSVFEEDMGEYFLQVRKEVQAKGGKGLDGKAVTSIVREGLSGWVDWTVINRLYDDVMMPLIYRIPCHVYAATKVQELRRGEKDPELLSLYGDIKVRPSGQKNLGHQVHTLFLFKPGTDKWTITTVKDRGNRGYFKDVQLNSLYMQYLVVKAGWPTT